MFVINQDNFIWEDGIVLLVNMMCARSVDQLHLDHHQCQDLYQTQHQLQVPSCNAKKAITYFGTPAHSDTSVALTVAIIAIEVGLVLQEDGDVRIVNMISANNVVHIAL